MNGYLLDTHVLIWWLEDPSKISEAACEVIAKPAHTVYVSAAAAWEMGIKKAMGRLDFPADLADVLENGGIHTLPITLKHGLAAAELPAHHQDPFDRMMVAQAVMEDLVLITRDPMIQQYDVAQLKA